jgi:2-polyprenyl-3-methyl-5-hydroxy-6-metoxy-1,4-benzoquinol methylase
VPSAWKLPGPARLHTTSAGSRDRAATLADVLTEQQAEQEAQYAFPYHYLDLGLDEYQLRYIEYRSLLKLVTDRVGRLGGSSVLDAGCGDGRLSRELHRAGLAVTGVDYSDQAVAFARAFNPEVEFVAADLAGLELHRSYDTVVFVETLEHLPPGSAPRVLERLRHHLAAGGHLIVTVPSVSVPVPEKHYRHFDRESLADALAPYFRIVDLDGYLVQDRHAKVFWNLRRAAYLLHPVVSRLALRSKVPEYLGDYFDRHLALGPPERCEGLMATCQAEE